MNWEIMHVTLTALLAAAAEAAAPTDTGVAAVSLAAVLSGVIGSLAEAVEAAIPKGQACPVTRSSISSSRCG